MSKSPTMSLSIAANIVLLASFLVTFSSGCFKDRYVSQIRFNTWTDGQVPDSLTAIKIAKAVWVSVYGDFVLDEEPFVATLAVDTVWRVSGSLPDGWLGGVANATIRKSDGKVFDVIHGQ